MIKPIELDNNIYFDPYTSCIYFNTVLTDEERDKINKSIKDKMMVNKHFIIENKKHVINNLTIIPTMNCQGNCSYCYNKHNNNLTDAYLNIDTLKNTIEKLKKDNYSFDVTTINFYGGEPFLNEDIEQLVDYLFSNNIVNDNIILNISSSLLYNNEIFNRVVKTCIDLKNKNIPFFVSISIDFGTNEKNYTRISTTNSYINKKTLIDRANILMYNNIPIKLSSIVTALTNIKQLEIEIKQHYLSSLFYNTNINYRSLNVNSLFNYRIAAVHNNELYLSNEKIDELFEFLARNKETLPITQNMFPYLDIIKTTDIVKISDNIYMLLYQPTYCGIYSRSITIMLDGNLSSCHMDPYNNNVYLTENMKDYDLIFNNKKCNNCEYYLVCRSGCININKETNKKEALDSYCYYLKQCINFSMQNFYNTFNNKKDFKLFLIENAR